MADVSETKAKVDALSLQIDQMQQRVTEDVQALKDKISSMEIDQAVVTEINQGLDQISARVQAIDPDPTNPPAPPPEA